jgi:hypothetical protein
VASIPRLLLSVTGWLILKRRKAKLAKATAATALREEARYMDEPTKTYYRTLFTEIHEQAGDQSAAVAEKMAGQDGGHRQGVCGCTRGTGRPIDLP